MSESPTPAADGGHDDRAEPTADHDRADHPFTDAQVDAAIELLVEPVRERIRRATAEGETLREWVDATLADREYGFGHDHPETSSFEPADAIRGAVGHRLSDLDDEHAIEKQVDVDVPRETWERMQLKAQTRAAQGTDRSPCLLYWDTVYEFITLHANVVVDGEVKGVADLGLETDDERDD